MQKICDYSRSIGFLFLSFFVFFSSSFVDSESSATCMLLLLTQLIGMGPQELPTRLQGTFSLLFISLFSFLCFFICQAYGEVTDKIRHKTKVGLIGPMFLPGGQFPTFIVYLSLATLSFLYSTAI